MTAKADPALHNRMRAEQQRKLRSIDNYEIRQSILSVLRAGGSLADAAKFSGIRTETLRGWYARGKGLVEGKSATPRYRKFAAEIDKARASAKVQAMGTVFAAMNTRSRVKLGEIRTPQPSGVVRVDYITEQVVSPVALRAAEVYLAAVNPKRFGTGRQRVEISGRDGGPIEMSNPDEVVEARQRVHGLLGRLAVVALAHNSGRLPSLSSPDVIEGSADEAAAK